MELDGILIDAWNKVNVGPFSSTWESSWSSKMSALANGDEIDIELLGGKVRGIFKGEGVEGRSQSSLSLAGGNWKKLVWTSLAALSVGGNTLPLLGKGVVEEALPTEVRSKLRISIGDHQGLFIDPEFLLLHLNRSPKARNLSDFSLEVIEDPDLVKSYTVIWAKTNFNDNILTSMLWSWVAEGVCWDGELEIRNAWITAPTNKPESFSPGNTPLVRAGTFSGGMFWGLGTVNSLGMSSLFEAIENWRENLEYRNSRDIQSKFLLDAFGGQY